jgi:hypothetical protein
VLLHFELRGVRRRLKDAPPAVWAVLAAALLAGALLRCGRAPRHEVFYDEYEHADIAANVARTGHFAETLAGGPPDLSIYDLPSWPGAFHALLALPVRLGADAERLAFGVNALLGTLTVALVFGAAALAFESGWAGAAAAVLWALWPDHVRLSAAGDLTPFSNLWLAAALLAAAARRPWLLALCCACAVNTRFENLALLPFAAWLLGRERRSGALTLACLAALPPMALILLNRGSGIPGFTAGAGESLRSLGENLLGDLRLGRWDWLCVAALAAACALQPRSRRPALLLAAVSAAYLLGTSAFYRGVMDGPQARYSLAVLLPLVVAAGGGAAALAARRGRPWAAALVLAAFGLCLRPWAPGEDTPNLVQDRFVREAAASLPADALVLSFNPQAVLIPARHAAAAPWLLNEPAVAERAKSGLIVFEDWAWREKGASLEKDLRARYDWKELARGGAPSKPAAFWALTPKPAKKISALERRAPPRR